MLKLLKLSGLLLVKRMPYALVLGLCIYGLAYLSQFAFYRYAPPSFFLSVQSADIDTAQVNQPLQLTFCRTARDTYNNSQGYRSYFRLEDDRRFNAGSYAFPVDYEKGESCQIIPIPASRHPQKAGIYYAETTIKIPVKFDNYVFYKDVTYQTSTFRLSDTVQGLEDQIKGLQQEIEILKAILRDRGVQVPETVTLVSPEVLPSTSQPGVTPPNSSSQASSPPSQPPVATAPPDLDPPALQPAAGLITGLVNGTLNTLDDVTSGLLPNGIL